MTAVPADDVARAIATGELASPQRYENVSLFASRRHCVTLAQFLTSID